VVIDAIVRHTYTRADDEHIDAAAAAAADDDDDDGHDDAGPNHGCCI